VTAVFGGYRVGELLLVLVDGQTRFARVVATDGSQVKLELFKAAA
jgi:hypothetical protein